MRNRRYSEISESEESDEAPKSRNVSSSNPALTNSKDSSNNDSSSDSEAKRELKTLQINKTPLPKSSKRTVASSPLEKFLAQNPNLKKLQIKDVITKDDEVCFLELPKTINPEEFIGKLIHFDKRTKLKINKTKYVIEPNNEGIKPLTVLAGNLKVIHPVANLQIREYVKKKKSSDSMESVKFSPTLPNNLKVRHPLFGDQYEKKIVLDEVIQEKLNNTIDDFLKKKKKKKKHKERRDDKEESIFSLLESGSMGKKKEMETGHNSSKKKKHKNKEFQNEGNNEEIEHSINVINNILFPKETCQNLEDDRFGKKKKKHKKGKLESEDNFGNNDNEEKSSLNTTNEFLISGQLSHESECGSFEKKKKKHKKTKLESEIINQDNFKNETEQSERNVNYFNDIVLSGQQTSFESTESFEKKKKKKKRNKSESEGINQDFGNDEGETTNKKMINIISDVLIPSQTTSYELGESFEKKKKKHKRKEEAETSKKGIVNSTIIPGLQLPMFDFDVSSIPIKEEYRQGINNSEEKLSFNNNDTKNQKMNNINTSVEESSESSMKKKKKKQRDKSDDENSGISPKKKPKKEEETEETNSLILDILSRVKDKMEIPAKHKKKKESYR